MSERKNETSCWEQWIKQADRELANADRRWRYHNKSFDAMGDNIVARESASRYVPLDELIANTCANSFIAQIGNLKLQEAVRKLKPKQQEILYLVFWQEFNQAEAAQLLHCSQANVSKRLDRTLISLVKELLK